MEVAPPLDAQLTAAHPHAMLATVVVLISTLSAGLAALIADRRGREPGWFAVGGLLLGVIGILIAAFAATGDTIEQDRLDTLEDAKARARHLSGR